MYRKVVTALAASGLLLNAALPVFSATIEITGNGVDSTNKVYVDDQNTVGVQQQNYADIQNNVQTYANTGDNEVEKSTGGEVEIDTGDATVEVVVSNTLNSNSADVECCASGDYDLKISENGADTYNKIDLDTGEESGVYVTQKNEAHVRNEVEAKADTGDNEVEESTGGDVTIKTGDAKAGAVVSTSANSNAASISGDGKGGSLSAWIVGNGADSKNKMYLDLERQLLVEQSNYADLHNRVKAKAYTGDNEVEESTGGEVEIDTGDATALAGIDNLVNFNWADLDCGCLFDDYELKIGTNGADTYNKIKLDLDSALWAQQGNVAGSGIGNDLYAKADTGDNEVEESTDGEDGDPTIETGDALIETLVENTGNANVVGGMPDFEWPEMPDFGDMEFQFGFNWAFLWAWMSS